MQRVFGVMVLSLALCGVPQTAQARPVTPAGTTLGILTPAKIGSVGASDIIAEARALGIHTVRASQDLTNTTLLPRFTAFRNAGMDVVFSAVYQKQADGTGHSPAHPPATPDEIALYKQRLGTVLDQLHAGPIAAMQVENEENSTQFFAGTMPQYVNELNAAVEVAHARGVKVTNGGITFKPAALLAWRDLKDRGREDQADDFARRVFTARADRGTLTDLLAKPFAGLRNQTLQAAYDRAKSLIPAFAASAMDYVNFHWYGDNSRAFKQVARYLKRATHKPAVTTEIGQYTTDAAVTLHHLTAAVNALRMPLVVWFDADGIPALGLHDAPGQLRSNGAIFKYFVERHQRGLN